MSGDITVGIDYGARKVAIAALQDYNLIYLSDLVLTPGVPQIEVLPLLVSYTELIVKEREDVGLIAVEAPVSGSNRNTQTLVAMAMTAGALISYLTGLGFNVVVPPPSTWKKATVGFGNASKDEVRAWVDAAWPRLAKTQDQADALCLARYARLIHHEGGTQ